MSGYFIWNTDEDEVEQKIQQQIRTNEVPQLKMSNENRGGKEREG